MPAQNKIKTSKNELRDLYLNQKLSMADIANRLGCSHSAIVYKFKRLGIKSRGNLGLRKPINVSKEGLKYLYYERTLSLKKIAKICHCSESGIERRFRKYDLKSRGFNNRACKYKKFNFSNNSNEKAYLIGFRLGDLNVVKRVNVIQARCSTTIYQQLKLIRKLFSPYTTVRATKGKRGDWDIVALVNKSFDFLLTKHKKIPKWILGDQNTFFAFFAGYIDAEGYFYFQGSKKPGGVSFANFGVQTQDRVIIHQLFRRLKGLGIKTRGPHVTKPAGKVDKNGIKNNKDMWCIEVSRKESLWKLIHSLKPYLKHGAKVKRLRETEKNLIFRNSAPYCRPINLAVL